MLQNVRLRFQVLPDRRIQVETGLFAQRAARHNSTVSELRSTVQAPALYARRKTPRVDTPEGVWVYWRYAGRDDTSRVRNVGTGGLFIETEQRAVSGANIRIDFLVQEGQVRVEGVIKHVDPGKGVGVKFTAVKESDGSALAALLRRLNS